MQEICEGLKEKQQPHKTPEQLSDEDYKVGPTSADKERMPEQFRVNKNATFQLAIMSLICKKCSLFSADIPQKINQMLIKLGWVFQITHVRCTIDQVKFGITNLFVHAAGGGGWRNCIKFAHQ